MELFEYAFSHICGSTNVWVLGGETLPFCQRCTGLYVGGVVALFTYLVVRPRPTSRLLWLHGALLLGMVPFGYHWVEQNGLVRTTSGFLFACGVVYFLLLLPFDRFRVVYTDRSLAALAFIAFALLTLLVSVSTGGPLVAGLVAAVGFFGLVSFALLAFASVLSLARG